MRKITAQHTDEEWEQLIQECNSSGLSKSKWCRERGIPNSSLLSAIKRLEHTSLLSDEMSQGKSTERKELIPLILLDDEKAPDNHTDSSDNSSCQEQSAPALSLSFKGIHLSIHNHAGRDVIQNTLWALQQI